MFSVRLRELSLWNSTRPVRSTTANCTCLGSTGFVSDSGVVTSVTPVRSGFGAGSPSPGKGCKGGKGGNARQNTVSFSPVFGDVITTTPSSGTSLVIAIRRASFNASKYVSLAAPTLMNGVTTGDVDHLMRCQPASSLQTIIL